ncbi:MAG: glutamate--tRNA ligase [Anaerolineae bacterium]|nr:glutamate--tRNA ligase [Anaerolineae bacterium]
MDSREDSRPVRVRIAPSPTGNCHVGTARNALYNLLYARQHGGAFILRIDDTDSRRSTAASEQGVLEGLHWLGLQWDEGPDIGGPFGPYRQSERVAHYDQAVRQLLDAGRAYHCFCTRDDVARERARARAAGVPYRYSGACRDLPASAVRARLRAGEPAVVRLRIDPRPMAFVDLVQGAIAQDASLIGDPIIYRSNGTPTYSFATVVNEIEMQISHVLRSAEHIPNTFVQLQVYSALDAAPPAFGHFSLLLNPDRTKISKRAGATYIGEFRDMGTLPEAMVNQLALSGWNPGTDQEILSFDDLLASFALDRCVGANAIFDREKLLWRNGAWIRRLSVEDLARRIAPWLIEAGLLPRGGLDDRAFSRLVQIVALDQERLKSLADAPGALRYYYRDPAPEQCAELLGSNRYARRHPLPDLRAALGAALAALRGVDGGAWSAPALAETLDALTDQLGWKRAELLMPVRIAISGREATPPLFETMALLDQGTALQRLQRVVDLLPL